VRRGIICINRVHGYRNPIPDQINAGRRKGFCGALKNESGQFYALPQSPQTFKQLLMVSGYDRYYQVVKCFRDEDLRADRQPEFTQIDCEMAFVEQEDILNMFEGMIKHIFKEVKGIDYDGAVERMSWDDAMWNYGIDKPDTRFEMKVTNLNFLSQHFLHIKNI
jgi:aspartyl-tRNA synthetase